MAPSRSVGRWSGDLSRNPLLCSLRCLEGASQKSKPQEVSTSPCDSQSHDALKVRFSATVREEPEVEVGLV
jgi:hypothetical protein